MKTLRKRLFCAVIVGVLAVVAVLPVAAGTVTYAGNTEKFIFTSDGGATPTDLFEEFKDVMPGDTLTQRISVKNAVENGVKIRLYLCSEGADENSEAFLSQLRLTVKAENGTELFDAPADQPTQPDDWVYLGTVYSGGEVALDVTLEVPITLDNAFQDAVGTLNWKFRAEELPIEPTDPQPPQTGDSGVPLWILVLLIVSALAIAVLAVWSAKHNKKDK